ncbi:response regulator [Undibacterium sp. RTI2.1]|uniref:response regulator n=1 Tax=unclassified Undibacterium TaxID=2630295 RepID=UPI002AB4498E|nr:MULTISPECIES: response regulator [unclassified Undibacterium]MDY7538799.1 response regulator [Undibacterium sp. 5I1]MEB0032008.1 response regulator [Undibacterium sp. RTI2.1]MEB0118218.1 response regulator [Undibacterium sp. RTI2.2]MEB0232918.1 response regulator [Undibacterium sp. 10I3]MEB0258397.1 response regulator [Undibacterium sp. 5I1]
MNDYSCTTENSSDTYRLDDTNIEAHSSLIYVFGADKEASQQLTLSLAIYNHEVIDFSDLDELRAAVLIRTPHALVLDIDSNKGQESKLAFANSALTSFPVIYISGKDNFTERLAAVREGAVGYFIKPLDIEALSTRLDEKIAKNEVMAYRILVVDDDEILAEYYEAVLSSAGMHVKSIYDPSSILDAIKKFKPELIITDLNMPTCTGIEMSKIIRQNNRFVDIPIVFLSSETEREKQISAIATGADDFLNKPINPEDLISAVANRAERYRSLRNRH